MNLVGHIEVASRCGYDTDGLFGSILPDVASMLRARINRDALPAEVEAGVALHHSTDAVFHGHPEVRASMAALGASLHRRGIGRGAARSVAHVGYEMLLDAAATDRLAVVMADADDRVIEVAFSSFEHWPDLRRHFESRTAHHDDPDWVADRLHRILAHRPRLAFSAEQIPAVADALAEHLDHIQLTAPTVFAIVTSSVQTA